MHQTHECAYYHVVIGMQETAGGGEQSIKNDEN